MTVSESEALRRVRASGRGQAGHHAGLRGTGRPPARPGRAFERTDYRFDIVSDYGAFRDLQRHRMLSIEWQPLTPSLGYDVPDIVEEAGFTAEFEASLARGQDLYESMARPFPIRPPMRWPWPSVFVTSCR